MTPSKPSRRGTEQAGKMNPARLNPDAGARELERMASTLDREATKPLPDDIIRHLKLSRFPDKGKAADKISAPKGYTPRSELRLNLPAAKAVERPRGKALAAGRRKAESLDAHVPPHLAVRTIPRTRPLLERSSAPMEVKRSSLTLIGMDMRAYPWSAIGHVRCFSEGRGLSSGTGFMVGPNLLMTASHVMPWAYSGNCQIEFVPAMHPSHGAPFGSTWVSDWYGVPYDGFWDLVFKPDAEDYVICRTIDPIGNVCGWLGTQAFDDHDDYFDHIYMSAGYPDFANGFPAVEPLAFIRDVDGDKHARELETVNFGSHGWSGGPLFGRIRDDWRAVGVAHGKETEFVAGIPPWNVNFVFGGGNAMVDLVYYGYDNYA